MNLIRRAIFTFVLLAFAFVNAQTVYKEYKYGVKEGLNSENVYKTIVAPSGELYISTQRGISLYDGYRFIQHPDLKTNVLGFYFKNGKFYFSDSNGLNTIENIYSKPENLVKSIPTDRDRKST